MINLEIRPGEAAMAMELILEYASTALLLAIQGEIVVQ